MIRAFTRARERRRAWPRGFTLIEMLTVLVILVFLITFFGRRFLGFSQQARVRATQQLINKISTALALYQAQTHSLPPDTGYGMTLGTKVAGTPEVVTYDSGSLWRYLAQPIVRRRSDGTVVEQLGPYLSFRYDPQGFTEVLPYEDPVNGKSFYVVDAWHNPIGYVGNPKRVVHNRGFCDVYSAGPDGLTAQDFTMPKDLGQNQAYDSDGDVALMGNAAMNGSLTASRGSKTGDPAASNTNPPRPFALDDVNNWDPQE